MEIAKYIIDWFCSKTMLSVEEVESRRNQNYFEMGWINSFETLTLVTDIEEKFEIRFINDDFQNPEFVTVDGLCRIIEEKINA